MFRDRLGARGDGEEGIQGPNRLAESQGSCCDDLSRIRRRRIKQGLWPSRSDPSKRSECGEQSGRRR
jgi:hypothetical protein